MTTTEAMISVVIMAAITILIRVLPFAIFSKTSKTPKVITYLGKVLPYAIMGMLVVFCLKDMSFSSIGGWLPYLMACIVTSGLYIFKKNTLLSIGGGTLVYMLLVQFVFK